MKRKKSTRNKRYATITFLMLLFCSRVLAQVQTISGVVTDTKGQPLPGVTVLLKNTSTGATTAPDGTYSLTSARPLSFQDVIIFSFIGFQTAQVPFKGNTAVNIHLAEDEEILDEVLVTALGIRREEKSLGYAAQNLSNKAVKDAPATNWVSSLHGKVAGLNLAGTNSGPVGSARINLRGESSLNLDNNQALIVVDGVPISSRITGTGLTRSHNLAIDGSTDKSSARLALTHLKNE